MHITVMMYIAWWELLWHHWCGDDGKVFPISQSGGGLGIVVGISTGYELDRPGIKSQWGQGLLYLSRPAPRSTSLLYNGYWVFPRGKVAEVCCWLPTPSSTVAAMGWSYNSASLLWLRRDVMKWLLPLSVSEPWPPTLCLITSLTELCHWWQILSQ